MRAAGLELVGEMPGSGYRSPPALVRRGDGQMVQLTPLLYAVLEAVDGQRDPDEVAELVSVAYRRRVTGADVTTLVDAQLRPLGLLLRADGSAPELKRSRPLLGLSHRVMVTDPTTTRRITAPFALLFHPAVSIPVIVAFFAISWWLLLEKGVASATHEAFHRPGLLLLVFAVTVLSAGFHEFGHAAAARRGGSTPGAMGAGLYLFWPAFYTDVTDSYRLGRGGRLRTDLGGLYFNAIVAVAITGVWWLSGYDALLLVVVTQILQMVRQLIPIIRFDGYHVLADLTGVPDLYHRIGPTLLALVPGREKRPEAAALKPWARAVVTVWVLLVVPLLALTLLALVVSLPRVLATAWVSLQDQVGVLGDATGSGDLVTALARVLAILALVLPIAGIAYVLTQLARRVVAGVWKRTDGRPVRRTLAALVAAGLAAGLGHAWTDGDRFRPIAAYERGTLGDALPLPRPAPTYDTGLAVGQEGDLQVVWPRSAALPTRDAPQLALMMIPRGYDGAALAPATDGEVEATDGTAAGGTGPAGSDAAVARPWVFPFDQPLPSEEGDNQSLAVNTEDETVVYDLAFALVFADGEEDVTNVNEAYAFASCTDCAAVAISFQVVLVLDDADVVVPQNLAVSSTYGCVRCLTYALASQLVITVSGPLGADTLAALNEVWATLADYATRITSVPLAQMQADLQAFQDQIREIILADPAATGPDDGPTDEPAAEVDGTPSPGVEETDDPADPTESDEPAEPVEETAPAEDPSTTDEPTVDPTDDLTVEPSEDPATEPTSEP
ncbi:MAG: hypothetical protein JWN84_793, partial [Nocardioides sp.]|nr:hypothetical protein [Nocardioides sp.]